ncbi:hypothetical protein F4823DRAFT_229369 [Ustulina deusta]|nr:hypothetical protein F4823DRAFT_229369 [Ustulina deusta]
MGELPLKDAGKWHRFEALNSKDTLCRNVLIYGHCRYEDQGCAFNHDQNRNSNNSSDHTSPTALIPLAVGFQQQLLALEYSFSAFTKALLLDQQPSRRALLYRADLAVASAPRFRTNSVIRTHPIRV